MKILVVDDETIIREWLQMSLREVAPKDTIITLATDGVDALKKLEDGGYDIAFVDIQMPRMDGITLLEEIRKTNDTIALVILSSHNEFDYARQVLRYGAVDYLLKTECTKETPRNVLDQIEGIHSLPVQPNMQSIITTSLEATTTSTLAYSDTDNQMIELANNIIMHIRNYNNTLVIYNLQNFNIFITDHEICNFALIKDMYYNIIHALYLHYYSDSDNLMNILELLKASITELTSIEGLIEFIQQSINEDISLLAPNAKYSAHTQAALLYIADHYREMTTVREIAEAIHLNFEYFTRLFKREVGENVNTYLRNYRLNIASQMLKTTTFPISDIACHVGMDNISYFSKTFKELYGMQPVTYRNSFR